MKANPLPIIALGILFGAVLIYFAFLPPETEKRGREGGEGPGCFVAQ
jgi:hypothetical protein